MESKGTLFERRCLQFPPRRQQAWKETENVLSCPKTADSKRWEKFVEEGNLSEAAVLLNITLEETRRIRRVITGILPHVKVTNLIRDANSAKSVFSGTSKLTISPAKSRRKVVEKVLLLH